jgi:hypothetical protein
MSKPIFLPRPALSYKEAAALKGQLLCADHYDPPALGGPGGEDATVFKLKGGVLLKYLHQPPEIVRLLDPCMRPLLAHAATWSERRQANSGTIGYLDAPFYRATKFTQKPKFCKGGTDLWEDVQPLIRALDALYRVALPDHHAAQSAFARITNPYFVIPHTCFTTGSVNEGERFPCHRDAGNLALGMSVMTVWKPRHHYGGSLVFPRWRIAVDMLVGDVLFFRGYDWHGNAPFDAHDGLRRISLVLYFRRGMLNV